MDTEETVMTDLYRTRIDLQQSEYSAELCQHLPAAFQELEIQSILDCGCGNTAWFRNVDLSGITYLGVDIVDTLLSDLQARYTTSTRKFQKTNCLRDPPETADLWLARDLLCMYPKSQMMLFFQRFLESKSPFLALTSVDTVHVYTDYVTGSWIPLNLQRAPLYMPEPLMELEDGEQWFCKKWLYVYNRQQILEWNLSKSATVGDDEAQEAHDTQDMNAHLVSNIPLRQMSLYAHTG
jgi:hypothetical protein